MSKVDQLRALREASAASPPPVAAKVVAAPKPTLSAIPASYKGYRDPDKRRAYMRDLMRKRRAEAKA